MYCPKCQRKRRTGERRRDLWGRIVWIVYCLLCKSEITIEDADADDPEADD